MKVCPTCQSRCFDDMAVCYGCLHRFTEKSVEDGLREQPSIDTEDFIDVDEGAVESLDHQELCSATRPLPRARVSQKARGEGIQLTITIEMPGLGTSLQTQTVQAHERSGAPLSSVVVG